MNFSLRVTMAIIIIIITPYYHRLSLCLWDDQNVVMSTSDSWAHVVPKWFVIYYSCTFHKCPTAKDTHQIQSIEFDGGLMDWNLILLTHHLKPHTTQAGGWVGPPACQATILREADHHTPPCLTPAPPFQCSLSWKGARAEGQARELPHESSWLIECPPGKVLASHLIMTISYLILI